MNRVIRCPGRYLFDYWIKSVIKGVTKTVNGRRDKRESQSRIVNYTLRTDYEIKRMEKTE